MTDAESIADQSLDTNPTFRIAARTDLDDIVRIVQAGSADDPETDYWSPFRAQYPDDYAFGVRRQYQHYLDTPEKYVVHIVEQTRPIAVAVWDIAVKSSAPEFGNWPFGSFTFDEDMQQRRDIKPARHEAFMQMMQRCTLSDFSNEQFRLMALVCVPEARTGKALTMLMEWAMEHESCYPVKVFASARLRRSLFLPLGFRDIATVLTKVTDEKEYVAWVTMEWCRAAKPE